MKINGALGFILSTLIVIVLGVALLFTSIWYTVLFSGLVASIVIRRGYLISILSSFAGGVLGILIIFLMLPTGYLGPVMNEVGAIAGIPSVALFALIFLINGGLCVSGALIGTFVARFIQKSR